MPAGEQRHFPQVTVRLTRAQEGLSHPDGEAAQVGRLGGGRASGSLQGEKSHLHDQEDPVTGVPDMVEGTHPCSSEDRDLGPGSADCNGG